MTRVRLKDIAKDLNVSVVTVSKVLRNHSDISEATKERVLKRMRELNYQPNWLARGLVSRRSYMIGLVVPDLKHSFFAQVAEGVAREVRAKGYQAVICSSEESPELEENEIEMLLSRQADAVVVASTRRSTGAGVFQRLENQSFPLVLIDRQLRGTRANFVGTDDEQIGFLATDHLLQQGCRRIAHIRGLEISTGVGRLKGYKKALAGAGIQPAAEMIVGGTSWDVSGDTSGYAAMKKLLDLPTRPDGVFCFNDPAAAGALQAILEAGLRVPEDIAVVGAGNIRYSEHLRVPLTTVDQSSDLVGQRAGMLILDLLASKDPRPTQTILINPRLVVRQSSLRKK